MNEVVRKAEIAPDTWQFIVNAPEIAQRRKAGQFVVLRVHDKGERFPLTLVGSDPDAGTIELIFQAVGTSTRLLAATEPGEEIMDLLTHLNKDGMTILQVTHSEKQALYGKRIVRIEDGFIRSDKKVKEGVLDG